MSRCRPASAAVRSADDMRAVLAEFEAVYAKINHRVSRYGAVGFSITELGLTATADKVKPVLDKRPLGTAPIRAAAHKGRREAYIGGRWHKADLYEMDLLAARPRGAAARPSSSIPPPRSSSIRGDQRLRRRVDAAPLSMHERVIAMLDKPASALRLRDRLLESEAADGARRAAMTASPSSRCASRIR